jgi:hypothetical protein
VRIEVSVLHEALNLLSDTAHDFQDTIAPLMSHHASLQTLEIRGTIVQSPLAVFADIRFERL